MIFLYSTSYSLLVSQGQAEATSRVWILPRFKDPYWKEKRNSPKDYYVGLREEWKFRVEEQEGLVANLWNMGLAIEMAEANGRELTENEHNNALNNEKYLSDYAMSDEDM
ncbi:hypothetical protein Vadar_014031 [Vaccinium darrowii]|uniref:Uncharacterized protein n=1 Tax=Vaccinium darrowii TaxID=229202 RepID=A0ACB7YNM8_9ERIC|nr:hypothetical protein Vadar_014031 [Vaccinium darrowii]